MPACQTTRRCSAICRSPFADGAFPRALGAVVQQTVLSGAEPAREVVHAEDGSWMVGDDLHDPNEPGASVATHIWHVIERDPAIAELADLPPGHMARRPAPGEPWVIEPHVWADE